MMRSFKRLSPMYTGTSAFDKVFRENYYLADKPQDKWFERHWFIGGNKGTAYVDGFHPEGSIVRTSRLLTNVRGTRTMTAAGPTRSFGPPADGTIITEELPQVICPYGDGSAV